MISSGVLTMSEKQSAIPDDNQRKFIRKKPYKDVILSEVEISGNYRLVGIIAKITDEDILFEDETGQIKLNLDPMAKEKIQEGDRVRICGFLQLEPEKKMNVNILQDFNKIDLNKYYQISQLEKSLKKNN